MSLRSADIRFLLPQPPRTAAVSAKLPDVRAGFAKAGVAEAEEQADVAVVMAADAGTAARAGARALVVIGRGGRRALRPQASFIRRFISLPGPHTPHLIVPVDRLGVASYAIRTWTVPESLVRRARNELAQAAIAVGGLPDLSRSLTLGLASQEPPFVVAAGEAFGVPRPVDWFLTLGLGDALTRAAFQLFAPGESEPGWVLKFSRVTGYADPFNRDERGLRLAKQAGGVAAARAPRLLGRFEAAGLPASLEEAAVGRRLTFLLQGRSRQAEKRRAIDEVAAWILDVGRETAEPASALAEERHRLETVVLPHWRDAGIPADLVARVPDVPGVLQHNDLGCWNLVSGRHGFTAVDWESARRPGLPLWDLLYFLVDALVHLDGAWRAGEREAHAARLLRGETESSAILFGWLRTAIVSLAIEPSAVGPIATLGWLHHGLSPVTRAAAADALAPGLRSAGTYGEWMVRVWLSEPGLGPTWGVLTD